MAVILLQTCLMILHVVLRNRLEVETKKFQDIASIENTFLTTLAEDNQIRQGTSKVETLTRHYSLLGELGRKDSLGLNTLDFNRRGQLVAELANLERDRRLRHASLNQLLPKLTNSVRYIHEHHIGYLRNIFSRWEEQKDKDPSLNSWRGTVNSETELDIINVAVSIQASMLDIFDSFSKLERGFSPATIRVEFQKRIKTFYKMVKTLDDFSLDAQDGLLVEELLLNGRNFEESFTDFLSIDKRREDLTARIWQNGQEIMHQIKNAKRDVEISNRAVQGQISTLEQLLIMVSIFMFGYLLISSKRMLGAFLKTIRETEQVRGDLSYRIPIPDTEYMEFKTVYRAMNFMAQTIRSQVRTLQDSHDLLEERVAARTRELSEVNRKLMAEIEERIENEEKRRELEGKLGRAKKMEALGTLAGGVAHDLNNILSGIMSYPELILLDLPEDHPLRPSLMTIQSSGEKAATIVQDLLTLARRGVANFTSVNLNGIIRQFISSPECKKILLYHPKVRIATQLDSNLGAMIGSDVHLSKTIMNLVANAAESMADGGVIHISTANQYVDFTIRGYDDVKQGEYLKLTVRDHGEGIDQEDIERIFEPFFTKKQMGRSGTGLGMAVVWGTVKDHAGYIGVESEPGKGTTFTLYFPLDRDVPAVSQHAFISPDQYQGRGESVLVVDDIVEQCEIAMRILEKLGYKAASVSSGEDAVKYVRNQPVDILLLDMIMQPGIDGLETFRLIVGENPGQKAVIASGFSESEQVNEVQRLGAGAYIKKPYSFEQLGLALRRELDRS